MAETFMYVMTMCLLAVAVAPRQKSKKKSPRCFW